ncbi:MAG TPA: chromosome segregation SMC family protein [Nitrososphaeraceae archaeon]|nr:chromosome segregation SMC family protein [Nitrososphaeraceae archaeon]
MVFIKKLEIYGFKSFGFKNTVINLNNGLVAVTGPNGSGKSNVIDAIMFGLGENSPKALRVDKFQSLFHDTQNNSHKLVRVSITFDNKNRGIPIDSDNVTLTREMEGSAGESQYHLNGKKVAKSTITELLQIVVAVPNKLNIVQQGMITRISELNSEERRKIIEDIIGLSYFDEKKEESLKQLDEADRRLDIALARMSEIRKRIDELEVERNEQLRFQHIENDMKKYKAIKLSNEIRSIQKSISINIQELETKQIKSQSISSELKKTKEELEKLDLEKITFIKEVDIINKEKADISNRISAIVYAVEKSKAMLKELVSRIEHINQKLKINNSTEIESKKKINDFLSIISILEKDLEILNKRKTSHINELNLVDQNILNEFNLNQQTEIKSQKINHRLSKIISLNTKFELDILKIYENKKIIKNNLTDTNFKIKNLKSKIITIFTELQNKINTLVELKTKQEKTNKALALMETKVKEFNDNIEQSKNTLNNSDTESFKFYEKNRILTDSMYEDLTISEIIKNNNNQLPTTIVGIVHDLIKWDKNYHRAVMAVGAEWMKAIVVNNVQDMIQIAEFAKMKKLPRVKIIPLDVIELAVAATVVAEDITNENISVIGNLSNFVISDFEKLVNFIFGNTIVVRTASEAYSLSLKGYRSVSIDGELFELESKSLLIDYNSTIINFVTEINLKNDIESLRSLILKLKDSLLKETKELGKLIDKLKNLDAEKISLENSTKYLQDKVIFQEEILKEKNTELKELEIFLTKNIVEYKKTIAVLKANEKRHFLITNSRKKLVEDLKKIRQNYDQTQLSKLNIERSKYQSLIDFDNQELQNIMIKLTKTKNENDFFQERINILNEETINLNKECSDKELAIADLKNKIEKEELDLNSLRDKEQNIISSSGNSYTILQSYEEKIKILLDNERKLSRDNSSIEREIVLLDKEIVNLKQQEVKLNNDLIGTGHKHLIDDNFDVHELLSNLSEEYEILKSRINLRADETYVQIVDGYRGMSARKNDLEKERNSIVIFIEEINKEKNNMFMDAFNKINNDINYIFSTIIGGNAWLEIENPDDIFSKGVRLIVQFTGKPKRDSTGLSGGEKTMAATIFLLALQAIKPSPFYLMDEVDAHLDAQNTERLSKILFERSKNNQIIMVTLKDSTISKVDQVYGVFPREGISHIVKYKYPTKNEINEEEISLN